MCPERQPTYPPLQCRTTECLFTHQHVGHIGGRLGGGGARGGSDVIRHRQHRRGERRQGDIGDVGGQANHAIGLEGPGLGVVCAVGGEAGVRAVGGGDAGAVDACPPGSGAQRQVVGRPRAAQRRGGDGDFGSGVTGGLGGDGGTAAGRCRCRMEMNNGRPLLSVNTGTCSAHGAHLAAGVVKLSMLLGGDL